jgi:hypothetical protein
MTSHVSPSATNEQGGTAEEGPVRWQRASERRRRGQAPPQLQRQDTWAQRTSLAAYGTVWPEAVGRQSLQGGGDVACLARRSENGPV